MGLTKVELDLKATIHEKKKYFWQNKLFSFAVKSGEEGYNLLAINDWYPFTDFTESLE